MATYKQPCMHCGTFIEGDARFCPACASGSPFAYLCPSCHREINKSDALCAACGRSLYAPCPSCGMPAFVGEQKCGHCAAFLMVVCPNPRCGQRQFFQNTKCTACGKKIKKQ
jgi:RNA polymerase subunit RPABC4/transcription elongation factor Spt4